ncbi:hypothetical protein [Variovorax atrisoli]|uniref:hypothetical protein n=1 Tax=Variovorax atrisoli TaxID=3394203 RepID=UPI0016104EA2|nr:hypothetical protein [Variovorax sp. BK613]MBB3642593.1 hypothetical protein [Variovorax sp. BK613]
MKTFKIARLVRDGRQDGFDLVIETTDGSNIELRIPADKLNQAIASFIAGERQLSNRPTPSAPRANEATTAIPLEVEQLSTKAETADHAIIFAHSGHLTLALHMSPSAVQPLAEQVQREVEAIEAAARTRH